MQADMFIGKSKKEAQDLAEKSNMIFRLVSVDEKKFLGWPEDKGRADRICVELKSGKVINAEIQ